VLLSTDALETFLDAGDEGLEAPERIFNMGTSFNTGRTLPKLLSNLHCIVWHCQPQMTPHADGRFVDACGSQPVTACFAAVRSQQRSLTKRCCKS